MAELVANAEGSSGQMESPITSVILRDTVEARQRLQVVCMSPGLHSDALRYLQLANGTKNNGSQRQTGAHRAFWKGHFPTKQPEAGAGSLCAPAGTDLPKESQAYPYL